nr:SDR family oxidoreductase [Maliibacterium massiliense]
MGKMAHKVVLITGGGKGIGLGLAQAFAQEGARLVLTGRTAHTLEEARAQLKRDYGAEVWCVPADGGNEQAVQQVVDIAVQRCGGIDVLINNAQTSASGTMLADHSKEDFDLAIYSGLYATFFYMKACFAHLKARGGCVINFASGAGMSGRAGQASYAAAKEGIRGLSRVAATEWGPHGVRVNVICPLAMTPGLAAWKEAYPALYAETIQRVPLGRFADPKEDIGRVCVFLASEDARYITGETITLQGGSGLRP